MKRFISVILALVFVVMLIPAAYAYDGNCSAKSAILYQPDTQSVLYEKNMYDKSLVASTTKILTALVVLENANIDEIVEIRSEYTEIEGSSMYLKAGERFTVEELLYGMLLVSGNDAAAALACHVAGDIEQFAELMNEKAEELGCVKSHFANPHGLDADGHYSCTYDLALIMASAMNNDVFARISETKSIEIAGQTFTNHNKLLWNCDGVTGGKTGYTMAAGRILVSSCRRDEMDLICVTINDSNDWQDHSALYDWGYEEYKLIRLDDEFKIPVISGEYPYITACCEDVAFLTKKDETVLVEYNIPKFVYAPISKGETAGSVRFISDSADVTAVVRFTESAELDESVPLTMWEQLKWSWYYYNEHSGNIPYIPRY